MLEKYITYKDSGIEWLGEIPEHWKIRRIKDIASTKSGTTPLSKNKLYYENGIYNWIRTTDLNNHELYDVEYKITELAIAECRMKFLPIDSVLIAMYGGFGTIGKNAILKKISTINQSVCSVLPNLKKFDSKYLLYFFKYFRDDWRLFADGTRKDPNINQEAVKNLFIYLPPLKEQTQIANYLDTKTTAIDKKIKLLKRKIKHYKAYRKSLINEAVTKGLDKKIKLKDSGIDWIGMIPENWEVKRIKDVFTISRGRAIAKTELLDNGKYPVYSSQTKNNGVLGYINTYDLDNDLLTWTTDGVNAGTVFIREGKFNCTNICGTLIPNKNPKLSLEFMAFAVQESSQHNKRIDTNGAKIMSNEMAVINIVFPPFQEQVDIAEYIKLKADAIVKILKNIEAQINALKELRKTLINEVVTGKVKVSQDLQ